MKRLRQRQRLQKNKEKNKPAHIEWAGFSMQQTVADIVEATRFELAASASRTQRSTKLSHASIDISDADLPII